MTEQETEALKPLVEAWERFLRFPVEHPDDLEEFRRAIHAAQKIILCRPARRALADQAWLDARDAEFDDRWNARMNP